MKYTYNLCSLPENSPKVIDLYAGPGGTGLGCKAAGFQILAAIENDPSAATTYQTNLGVVVKRSDINDLHAKDLRIELKLEVGDLDVLIGCSPCQGFTRMRNDNGAGDPRNELIRQYISYVEEFQPRFALFENVPGLVRSKHGKLFYQELRQKLTDMGYGLVENIVDAADYGVAQHRRRAIVIAGRNNKVIAFPRATHGNPNSNKVKNGQLLPWVTVRDVISDYPNLIQGEDGSEGGIYPNHKAPRMGEKVMGFISKVPPDGGSRRDVPRNDWLKCHLSHDGHSDVYGRLSWDKPSNTITSGCTNVSRGRFVHPSQNRGLTHREAAALQSFPDNYVFYGKGISAQIGNAVPPCLAHTLMKALYQEILAARSDNNTNIASSPDNQHISEAGIVGNGITYRQLIGMNKEPKQLRLEGV